MELPDPGDGVNRLHPVSCQFSSLSEISDALPQLMEDPLIQSVVSERSLLLSLSALAC